MDMKTWRKHEAIRDSQNLIASTYCTTNNIPIHRWYYWRRKSNALPKQTFVEVLPACSSRTISTGLDLTSPTGWQIHIDHESDIAILQKLLPILT